MQKISETIFHYLYFLPIESSELYDDEIDAVATLSVDMFVDGNHGNENYDQEDDNEKKIKIKEEKSNNKKR